MITYFIAYVADSEHSAHKKHGHIEIQETRPIRSLEDVTLIEGKIDKIHAEAKTGWKNVLITNWQRFEE